MNDACPFCNSRDIGVADAAADRGDDDSGDQECFTCGETWNVHDYPASVVDAVNGPLFADADLGEVDISLWYDAENADDVPGMRGPYVVDMTRHGGDGPDRWRYATLEQARAAYAVLRAGGTLPD